MTATEEATTPGEDEESVKPPQLQGGARWGSFGMPLEKSANFGASSRRLLQRLEGRRLGLAAIVAMAAASVCLSVLGPKMLGHATDIVVAGLNGEEGTVKFLRRAGGKVFLEPANSSFSPIVLEPGEATVYGRVVTVLRRL